jgi:hypothetical protein
VILSNEDITRKYLKHYRANGGHGDNYFGMGSSKWKLIWSRESDAQAFLKPFLGLVCNPKMDDMRMVFAKPSIEVDETHFKYKKCFCEECNGWMPHQYRETQIHLEDVAGFQIRFSTSEDGPDYARALERFRVSREVFHYFWAMIYPNLHSMNYQPISSVQAVEPLDLFRDYQCLACIKDHRLGALTIINPVEGALTVLDKGSLTLV